MDDSFSELTLKEILKSNSYSPKTCQEIDQYLQSLQRHLKSIPTLLDKNLSNLKWLDDINVGFPIFGQPEPKSDLASFCFYPPENFAIIGDFAFGSILKPGATVCLAVEIPQSVLSTRDHLNQTYHRKRALFLCIIAHSLKTAGLISEFEFCTPNDVDVLTPGLKLIPTGKLGQKCKIQWCPTLPNNFWKLNRFNLKISNLRLNWYFGGLNGAQNAENPTPFYNQSVLNDLLTSTRQEQIRICFENVKHLNDGLKLINLWLKLRFRSDSDNGYSTPPISADFVHCFLCHLIKIKRLQDQSSKKQIFRAFLLGISQSSLDNGGISLADEKIDLDEFRRHFSVVFVDFSGFYNLCYNWNVLTYFQLKRECSVTLEQMNANDSETIAEIFTRKTPFYLKFDRYFSVDLNEAYCSRIYNEYDQSRLADLSGNKIVYILNRIVEVLRSGLGSRVVSIDFRRIKPAGQEIDGLQSATYVFGILFDEANYCNLIDRGPPANDPEANEFRAFWGEKAEMRKFADSSICETCVWGTCESKMFGRTVIEKIVAFILKRHLKLPKTQIQFFGTQLDQILTKIAPKYESPFVATGEEEYKNLSQVFDQFAQSLRLLDELPLKINKIIPVSSYLRRTEVYPVLPSKAQTDKSKYYVHDKWLFPRPGALYAPPWCPSLEVQIALESSGKWPDDLEAVRKLKTAFYVQICRSIRKQMAMLSAPTENCAYVYYKGYVFRLIIAYGREITLLKRVSKKDGTTEFQESQESMELNLQINERPKIAGHINNLVQKYPSFSLACRCFKKWVSSHMLAGYLCDELQELLVAYVYIKPQPYSIPGSFAGFLRTLRLLATFDWLMNPLIVNLNDEIPIDEIAKIRTTFLALRPTLPPMCLVTPQDFKGTLWTKPKPTALVVDRLIRLATNTLHYVENHAFRSANFDFTTIFRTQLDIFDILLHLNERQIPKRFVPSTQQGNQETLHSPIKTSSAKSTRKKQFKAPKRLVTKQEVPIVETTIDFSSELLPVVDYDTVECLVNEIQCKFENLLCFYDKCGGKVVGLLFRPGFKVKEIV